MKSYNALKYVSAICVSEPWGIDSSIVQGTAQDAQPWVSSGETSLLSWSKSFFLNLDAFDAQLIVYGLTVFLLIACLALTLKTFKRKY